MVREWAGVLPASAVGLVRLAPGSDGAMRPRDLACTALALVTFGCVNPAYHVGIMARTVNAGDCGEAMARAREIEAEVPGFPAGKQAHYSLYRGMAHLCLGQADQAWYWLARVEVMRQRFPMILTGEHFVNYQMAMERLGNDPRVNRPLLLATVRRDMDRDAARYRMRQEAAADGGSQPVVGRTPYRAGPPPGYGPPPSPNRPPPPSPPSSAVGPAQGPPPPQGSDPAPAGAAAQPPEAEGVTPAATPLPLHPSRADVLAAMEGVRDEVRGCAGRPIGPVSVHVAFESSGHVSSASVMSPSFAGTPVGACMAHAVEAARVPPFTDDEITITFPF